MSDSINRLIEQDGLWGLAAAVALAGLMVLAIWMWERSGD